MLSPLVTAPLSSPALLIPSTLSQAEAPGQDYVCPCPLLHNSPYRSGQAMTSKECGTASEIWLVFLVLCMVHHVCFIMAPTSWLLMNSPHFNNLWLVVQFVYWDRLPPWTRYAKEFDQPDMPIKCGNVQFPMMSYILHTHIYIYVYIYMIYSVFVHRVISHVLFVS